MAYRAYLNDTELFFDSSVQDESFLLTYAVLDMQAGASGSFTFRIPETNEYHDHFQKLTSYVDVFRDDERIFSGRVYSIKDTFDLQKEVVCEGLLSILADSIFRPVEYDGTLHSLVSTILASHNDQVEDDKMIIPGTITVPDSTVYRAYQNYETSISRLSDLVESFGGYMSITKDYAAEISSVVDIGTVDEAVVDVGENGKILYLNWFAEMTEVCEQEVRLRSNLVDLKKSSNSNDVFTVLIPLGAKDDDDKRLTIESVNSGKDYILAPNQFLAEYGYIVATQEWDDIHEPAILKARAENWLAAQMLPVSTIEISAIDLADTGLSIEGFRVGQRIPVISAPHGMNAEFDCQKQKLDLLHPANNKLELGKTKVGYVQSNRRNSAKAISESIGQWAATKQAVNVTIEQVSKTITGNDGGYIVIHDSNNDGQPDEILIMDQPNITDARKVWRFNNSGLGYSGTGYNGTYGTAMTIDGAIVADYIKAGTMSANRLRTGLIESELGNASWNLDTGEFITNGTLIATGATLSGDLKVDTELNTAPNQPNVGYWIRGDFAIGRARIPTQSPTHRVELPSLMTKFQLRPSASTQSAYETYAIRAQTASGRSTTWTDALQNVMYSDYLICKNAYKRTVVVTGKDYDIESATAPTSGAILEEMLGIDSLILQSSSVASQTDVFHRIDLSGINITITAKGSGFDDWSLLEVGHGTFRVLGGGNSSGGNPGGELVDFRLGLAQRVCGRQIAFASSSSERYKNSIAPIKDTMLDPHKLLNLNVKQFRYNADATLQYDDMKGELLPGFIAEEVARVYPSAVVHDYKGRIETWDERRIIPGMLALIQELYHKIERLTGGKHGTGESD